MFTLITVNVFLYLLLLLEVETEDKPLAHRTVSFEDFREGYVLKKNFSKNYWKTSKSDCAKRCLAGPLCLSFNHCESQECEVNSGDIHSEDAILKKQSFCSYFGMRREQAVICEDMGVSRNVSHNSAGDRCKLELKKHDVNWSSWEQNVERSNSSNNDGVWIENYKNTKARVCLNMPAHGNICKGKDVRVERFKLVHDTMNWTDAKTACKNVGGKLFSELEKSVDQYDFINILLGHYLIPFWTGIKLDTNGFWRSLEGRPIPNIFLNWKDGEPNGSPMRERTIVIYGGKSYDVRDSSEHLPLCDMS